MSYLFGGSISVLVLLLCVIAAAAAHQHTVGSANIFGDVLQKTDLFKKNSVIQTNYTIRFKYVDNLFGGAIFFAQLNVTGAQNSTSEMDYSKDVDVDMYKDHQRYVDATLNVLNATNFTSSIEVRGFRGINIDAMSMFIRAKEVKPRSYAFICTKNDAKAKSQQTALIKYGERVPGDFLIRYRLERSEHGKLSFDFHDSYLKLTFIVVNVDSPWAVTFNNKIITTEDHFRATIYELKRNNFTAESFIFGRKIIRS